MHTTYNDVYYEVKVQGNNNLARICPTQLTIKKTKYRNVYLTGQRFDTLLIKGRLEH